MLTPKTKNNAFTLIEIMLAMAILAATMVPVFFFMSKGASETDFNVSRMFAISRASEILNAMLDNVPFQALRAGIPGFIKVSDLEDVNGYEEYDQAWAEEFMKTVFPGSEETAVGFPCQCIVKDPRGIHYKITLRVEDIVGVSDNMTPEKLKIGDDFPDSPPSEFDDLDTKELTFSYLKNPARLLSPTWHQTNYLPNPLGMLPSADNFRFELELPQKVSENPENFYIDEGYTGYSADVPRFVNPTAVRLTQRMARAEVDYTDDENVKYCGMKRLIIEIQWNIDLGHLDDPEHQSPGLKRIHLMVLKADVNV